MCIRGGSDVKIVITADADLSANTSACSSTDANTYENTSS